MKKRKINYRNLAILGGAVLLVLLLVIFLFSMLFKGCFGKQDASQEQSASQTAQTQDSTIVTFGDKAGGTEINLDNQCGQAIVSFKVRGSDSGDFGDNLLGDSRIKNKSTAKWYAKSDDTTMNVEVKLANYTSFVLHDIPVNKFNGLVTIKYKEGVGYLEYKPKDSENTISTYQDELKYKDQKDSESKQADTQQNTDGTQTSPAVDESTVSDDSGTYDETYTDPGAYDDESYTDDGSYTGDTTYDDGSYSNGTTDAGYTEDGTAYDVSTAEENYGY